MKMKLYVVSIHSKAKISVAEIVLEAKNLSKHYEVRRGGERKTLKALDGVGFQLKKQETLGIVGESGCGKSTLAKLLMQIESPTSGEIELHGKSLKEIPRGEYLRKVQMIFQDPYGSLNPRKKAGQIIAEPLLINSDLTKTQCLQKAVEMMEKVGLRSEYANRYPHMFSGGQRQRIGIARALMMRPEVLICDEPVSALDVSVQAQVINLLIDLQDQFGLSYIFISHDLSIVRHLVDEMAVMYLGKFVERGSRSQVYENTHHPYTKALLESTPQIFAEDRSQTIPLQGEVASPFNPPSGCTFHGRCPIAEDTCRTDVPSLRQVSSGHEVSCPIALDVKTP